MPFPALIPAIMGAASSVGSGAAALGGWGNVAGLATSALPFLSKSKSKGGSAPSYDVITMPQYSFTEPRLRLMSDFVSSNYERIGQGKFPAYYDNATPYIRESLERPLRTTYFGRPGDRTGTVQAAMEASSIMGTGPRSGTAQVNKALTRYEEASKQIDEFIAKTGVEVTQDAIGKLGQIGLGIPSGPPAQVVGYPGSAPIASSMTDTASMLAATLPYLGNAMQSKFPASNVSPMGSAPALDGGGVYYPGYQQAGASRAGWNKNAPSYLSNRNVYGDAMPGMRRPAGASGFSNYMDNPFIASIANMMKFYGGMGSGAFNWAAQSAAPYLAIDDSVYNRS